MSNAKPVDLAAMRALADSFAAQGARAISNQISAASDELDALRGEIEELEAKIQDMIYTNMGDDL